MSHKLGLLLIFTCCTSLNLLAQYQNADSLLLTPEKTDFKKTSTYKDVMTFLTNIQKQSKNVHVFSMGKSKEGKEIPVAVLANPSIKTPEEAHNSGKLVIYVQGNIHAGEVEGKESLMILMRDILLGNKKNLLDSLIILFAPIYNTDANDKMAKGLRPSQEDSPPETGERESSEGYDLNRDGVKMDALETKALFENVIVPWDPQIFVDLHTTNGTWHAFPLTWAPSAHSAGEKSVFDYSYYKMLPQITLEVFQKHNLQFGVYGDYYLSQGWPPTNFYSYNHHPRYLVNQFGLRNRIAILSEAFAHNRFYERINSTYVFVSEILNYANSHATEIIKTTKSAELASIQNIKTNAGKIKKGVQYKMVPLDTLDNFITYDYIPGNDKAGNKTYFRTGKIVAYNNVTYYSKYEATKESLLPSGYIIPAEFTKVVDNLRSHGVTVTQLTQSKTFHGESFLIDSLVFDKDSFQHHRALALHGKFKPESKTFKKGDYQVNLAQPLCNLIFYLLEPESDDGLVHWNYFDQALKQDRFKTKYSVFKYINP
jgi:hypothetical protein